MTRFSVDSNIHVYVVDGGSVARQSSAQRIVASSARLNCVLTTQAIAEFFRAVTRKQLASRTDATAPARQWMQLFPIVGASAREIQLAIDASNAGRFQFFDALLLATAGAAGCEDVISEDMHPGATLGAVKVVPAFDPTGGIAMDARVLLGL